LVTNIHVLPRLGVFVGLEAFSWLNLIEGDDYPLMTLGVKYDLPELGRK
jgi:hypothetical protein